MDSIMSYIFFDKKNKDNKPQFVLLEAVGKPVWDVEVPAELVRLSLEHTIDVLGVPINKVLAK